VVTEIDRKKCIQDSKTAEMRLYLCFGDLL